MARIIYLHPRQSNYDYHIFTDLDFWDARRILKDLVTVKRIFGEWPPGDEFPTQIVAIGAQRAQSLGCPGEEHALAGIGFLERVTAGDAPSIGRAASPGFASWAMAQRPTTRWGARAAVLSAR